MDYAMCMLLKVLILSKLIEPCAIGRTAPLDMAAIRRIAVTVRGDDGALRPACPQQLVL